MRVPACNMHREDCNKCNKLVENPLLVGDSICNSGLYTYLLVICTEEIARNVMTL